jgi:hypothetical protein
MAKPGVSPDGKGRWHGQGIHQTGAQGHCQGIPDRVAGHGHETVGSDRGPARGYTRPEGKEGAQTGGAPYWGVRQRHIQANHQIG